MTQLKAVSNVVDTLECLSKCLHNVLFTGSVSLPTFLHFQNSFLSFSFIICTLLVNVSYCDFVYISFMLVSALYLLAIL